ncbi:MAG: Lrp/AsnC ligand binding domain-containing protein [Nitrosopumilaceae archaeon]
MPTAYVLLNSDLGSDEEIISKIKELLSNDSSVQYEVQGVYGVYDIIVKITSKSIDDIRSIITDQIRKINKVHSTLTMMVIEEQG